jgi:DNA-binding transcriptional LysR family regulator
VAKIADWDAHIGRRLRLRDLHVFFAVMQSGSLSKAAEHLRVSHPAVSQVIADLEHALGVTLFDRSSRGVAPTVYARALLTRSRAAFDELRQGIRDIEFLADPTAGELTIGYPESAAITILPQIIERFSRQYPRVALRVEIVPSPPFELPVLYDRTCDLVIVRLRRPLSDDHMVVDDFNTDVLFDDHLVVAAGKPSRWSSRRKIDLAELINEPWILSPPKTWSYQRAEEAFKAKGLEVPKPSLVTYSMDFRAKLLATGMYITLIPESLLRYGSEGRQLKVLPVDVPMRPWPVALMTLKHRTLTPVVERFVECAHEVAKPFAHGK